MTTKDTRAASHDRLISGGILDREDFTQLAHDIVDNLVDVIDAIARQAAGQTLDSILAQRRPPTRFGGAVVGPSNETEAELVEARKVKALETIALALTLIANKDSAP